MARGLPLLRWLACLALASTPPRSADAQTPAPPPTVIVIRPAAPPVPALKYRLVPERRELIPGNAAVFYHRAIVMLLERQLTQARSQKAPTPVLEDPIHRWITGPIGEVPRDEARERLRPFENALHEVELGSLRLTCDWEFDSREEGFSLLLPEIQEMRSIGRLVALRARLAVIDGRPDEALHWLRVGSVISRHVSQGPILIQALVGCSIENQMTRVFEDLIQAPGTPNLYWTFADRPRPFIDLAASLGGESRLVEREVPGLRDLGGGPWTQERALRFADELAQKLGPLTSDFPVAWRPVATSLPGVAPRLAEMSPRLALAGMVMMAYPDSKRALIARGRPAAEVEAMPAVQAVALVAFQSYEQSRDDVYKWSGVPYWQAAQEPNGAVFQRTAVEAKSSNPLLYLFLQLVPNLHAARLATTRLDRQLDAFQGIEAIRLYAAAHDGTLPPSLEAIAEAPVPTDPATGKPFAYKVDGTTATLEAPLPPGAPNHPSYQFRYELKPAR